MHAAGPTSKPIQKRKLLRDLTTTPIVDNDYNKQ